MTNFMVSTYDPNWDRVVRYLHDIYDMPNKVRQIRILSGISALERNS